MAKSNRRRPASRGASRAVAAKPSAAKPKAPRAPRALDAPPLPAPRSTRPTFPPKQWFGTTSRPPVGAVVPTPSGVPDTPRVEPDPPATEPEPLTPAQLRRSGARPPKPTAAAVAALAATEADRENPVLDDAGVDLTLTMVKTPGLVPPASYANRIPGAVFALEEVGEEDLDVLWDWVRADPAGTRAFMGWTPKASTQLHEWFRRLHSLIVANPPQALIMAIQGPQGIAGFVMLLPIVHSTGHAPVGTVHIYLAPFAQGSVAEILPHIVAEADRVVPGMTLFVATVKPGWARVLESVGFAAQIVLTRLSPVKG